jgi:hypothetical protein
MTASCLVAFKYCCGNILRIFNMLRTVDLFFLHEIRLKSESVSVGCVEHDVDSTQKCDYTPVIYCYFY